MMLNKKYSSACHNIYIINHKKWRKELGPTIIMIHGIFWSQQISLP